MNEVEVKYEGRTYLVKYDRYVVGQAMTNDCPEEYPYLEGMEIYLNDELLDIDSIEAEDLFIELEDIIINDLKDEEAYVRNLYEEY